MAINFHVGFITDCYYRRNSSQHVHTLCVLRQHSSEKEAVFLNVLTIIISISYYQNIDAINFIEIVDLNYNLFLLLPCTKLTKIFGNIMIQCLRVTTSTATELILLASRKSISYLFSLHFENKLSIVVQCSGSWNQSHFHISHIDTETEIS